MEFASSLVTSSDSQQEDLSERESFPCGQYNVQSLMLLTVTATTMRRIDGIEGGDGRNLEPDSD